MEIQGFNIITLGSSGAGKTVFLASLFKQLSISAEEGIYLDIKNPEQQKELNGIYAQILNEESWPRGTTKATQLSFIWTVKTQSLERHSVCEFTYVDYKGGSITDSDVTGDSSNLNFDIKQKAAKADAIIVLIDGSQLYKAIQTDFDLNDKGIVKWLNTELAQTLILANGIEGAKPIHFVITKWDLLEKNYTLSVVRKHLEDKSEEFKRLVNARVGADCPVRLIPISSVGKEFVTMQLDGSMKKNLGSTPKPFHLEIPISYVLIDRVASLYRETTKKNAPKKGLLRRKKVDFQRLLLVLRPNSAQTEACYAGLHIKHYPALSA